MKKINFTASITNRDETNEIYFAELRKFKPLNDEQVKDLATRIKEGDEKAKETLIKANLRLVVSIAKKYVGMGVEFNDLICEGNIGLVMAAERYDSEKGAKFSTCAAEWVRKIIVEALNDNGRTVRLPENLIRGGFASVSVSFDAPIGNDDEGNEKTLMDTFASNERANGYDDVDYYQKKVAKLLNGLKQNEKEIVCGLFGIGGGVEQTEYTLARRFRVTEERIRQIKWEALKKMKEIA